MNEVVDAVEKRGEVVVAITTNNMRADIRTVQGIDHLSVMSESKETIESTETSESIETSENIEIEIMIEIRMTNSKKNKL